MLDRLTDAASYRQVGQADGRRDDGANYLENLVWLMVVVAGLTRASYDSLLLQQLEARPVGRMGGSI